MGAGFAFAASELTLVLFTTLAPSGAVAFALMGVPLFRSGLPADVRARLSKLLCIPLVVAMVGLVASATHLGNPDNALYVLAGVGRSPLSTEVACAVAFLALAGVFWLLTFSSRFPLGAQRAWLAVSMVLAAVFVAAVALAYRQPTIPTWSLWHVPVALVLNSLVGGPLLAFFGLRAARVRLVGAPGAALLAIAAASAAANAAVYALQGGALAHIRNAVGPATDLAPGFGVATGAFLLLCAGAVALDAWLLVCDGRRAEGRVGGAGAMTGGSASDGRGAAEGVGAEDSADGSEAANAAASGPEAAAANGVASAAANAPATPSWRAAARRLAPAAGACILAFVGIFIMRFAFYMTHMTVGLSF